MDKKSTIWVAIVVALACISFLFVFLRSTTIDTETSVSAVIGTTTPNVPDGLVETIITAMHAYRKGEHLIAGELMLPTSCHLLEHTVTILPDESRATIAFSRSFKGGECPGGEMPARFLVRFKSKADTQLRATLDGRDVTLSLIEAGPEEDIENTEIFIKG